MELMSQFPALQFVDNASEILFSAKSIHVVKLKHNHLPNETQYFFVCTRESKELYVCPHMNRSGTLVATFKKIKLFWNSKEVFVDINSILIYDQIRGGVIGSVDGNWFELTKNFENAFFYGVHPHMLEQAAGALNIPPECDELRENRELTFMLFTKFLKEISSWILGVSDKSKFEALWKSFKQIAFGKDKMLYLSDKHEVFELFIRTTSLINDDDSANEVYQVLEVSKIIIDKPIAEVAACLQYKVFAAVTFDGDVYMWGEERDPYMGLKKPTKTSFKTLYEPFYKLWSVTYKLIAIDQIFELNAPDLSKSLSKQFNHKISSDVTIMVRDRPIFLHKRILKKKCMRFNEIFESNGESAKTVLEVEDASYEAYNAVFYFLYTNCLQLQLFFAFDVLHLSIHFELPDLQERCEFFIRKSVNTGNLLTVYRSAVKSYSKILETFCIEYATKVSTKFMETDKFHHLESDVAEKFRAAYIEKAAFAEKERVPMDV